MKTNPAYKDIIDGKTKIFDKENAPVKAFYNKLKATVEPPNKM